MLIEGSNKKEKYIVPTAEGKKLIRNISTQTEHIENGTLESISENEISTFLNTAKKLAERMTIETEIEYRERG